MDISSFSGGASSGTQQIQRRWWTLSGQEACDSITSTLETLARSQSERIRQQVLSARLYGNVLPMGNAGLGTSMGKAAATAPASRDRVTLNVVQSVVDTVTAKMAKSRPKPLFLTSGGDYREQRKAKTLNRFSDGLFHENSAHALGVEAFRDACVFGDGMIHVFAKDERVRYERVLTSEIWVDELEGFYGQPRQLHRCKSVDRETLADAFSSHRSIVEHADQSRIESASSRPTTSDLVQVRESWHLPSGKDAGDGRHVISVANGILLSEPYERDCFPFARLSWTPRLWGFWAQGLAEQLQSLQMEINKLLWVIQRSMHLAGSYKVLIENTSKIVSEHLNNDIGACIKYSGTPPQYVTPPAVQPEIYQHLAQLILRAYEQAGVSQMSAAAAKPAGLNSGKALREFSDIESDRFSTIGKAYERFFLDLARLSIDTVKEISEEKGGYEVKSPGSRFVDTIDWSDIDLDDQSYVMQVYPVSSLPSDPAGRLQTVQEYMQAGLLSPRQGKRLLDFPDLEAVEGLSNASEEYLSKTLDAIVDEGEYVPPEPFDDLALARELALEYYSRGKTQGLEEERLELLRRFITQLDGLQAAAMPPPAPGVGAEPLAAPTAAPVSDLLPNAPGAASDMIPAVA